MQQVYSYFKPYGDIKLQTEIEKILKADWTQDLTIAFMADTHPTESAVVGLTIALKDKVNVNYVSADIGCGVLYIKLSRILNEDDFKKIDEVCNTNHFEKMTQDVKLASFNNYKALKCFSNINTNHADLALGTLGNGNHFIEIDRDETNHVDYLVIHSGSRNLGGQVFKYYLEKQKQFQLIQQYQINLLKQLNHVLKKFNIVLDKFTSVKDILDIVIKELKARNEFTKINSTLDKLRRILKDYKLKNDPLHFSYITGQDFNDYCHDVLIVNEYAKLNRTTMAKLILDALNLSNDLNNQSSSIHNIIGDDLILRKGAIQAKKDQEVIIPLNMKEGCIIGKSLGLSNYNDSAPHGAGRYMGRKAFLKTYSLSEFENDMKDIHCSTLNEFTLDEAPAAYKNSSEIIHNLKNVEILKIIKSVYNWKNDGKIHL